MSITLRVTFVYLLVVTSIYAANLHPERWYQDKYCTGQKEVTLTDRTRVDCLTSDYAIEYDFARKWTEGIGQSLHYAIQAGKKPGLVLIIENQSECKYVDRAKVVNNRYWLNINIQTVGVSC